VEKILMVLGLCVCACVCVCVCESQGREACGGMCEKLTEGGVQGRALTYEGGWRCWLDAGRGKSGLESL